MKYLYFDILSYSLIRLHLLLNFLLCRNEKSYFAYVFDQFTTMMDNTNTFSFIWFTTLRCIDTRKIIHLYYQMSDSHFLTHIENDFSCLHFHAKCWIRVKICRKYIIHLTLIVAYDTTTTWCTWVSFAAQSVFIANHPERENFLFDINLLLSLNVYSVTR